MRVVRRATLVTVLLGAAIVMPSASGDEPAIRVGFQRGGRYGVDAMALETYVARVLAGEAAHDSPPAALDALAIAVRTFALANRNRHRADGFDLCDQTHCQVVRAATPATIASAGRTSGRILMTGGTPASIYYTASCGGRTEIPSAVWPGAADPSFLPSRPDPACGGAPAWEADISDRDLLRALHAAGFTGDRLRSVRIVSRDRSGRVARLRIDGLNPPEISGQDLRVAVGRTLGWQFIKSTAFELKRTGDGYRWMGHGSGHGVGLCVIGSVHLAAEGQSAAAILAKYFPGLAVTGATTAATAAPTAPTAPMTSPAAPARIDTVEGILVSLPDGDDGERVSMGQAIARARGELARALAIEEPRRLVLRVHPTVGSFEAATGRPWYFSGAVVAGELHLPPLSALRQRGILERTIRRELVHVMVDSALDARPRWVRDGIALYFADPQRDERPAGRIACPDDRELTQPVSAGALATAYARARACVARQIAAGRSWRDVK